MNRQLYFSSCCPIPWYHRDFVTENSRLACDVEDPLLIHRQSRGLQCNPLLTSDLERFAYKGVTITVPENKACVEILLREKLSSFITRCCAHRSLKSCEREIISASSRTFFTFFKRRKKREKCLHSSSSSLLISFFLLPLMPQAGMERRPKCPDNHWEEEKEKTWMHGKLSWK